MLARKEADDRLTDKLIAEDEERLKTEAQLHREMWAESDSMELLKSRAEREVLGKNAKLAKEAAAVKIQQAWKSGGDEAGKKTSRMEAVLTLAGGEVRGPPFACIFDLVCQRLLIRVPHF